MKPDTLNAFFSHALFMQITERPITTWCFKAGEKPSVDNTASALLVNAPRAAADMHERDSCHGPKSLIQIIAARLFKGDLLAALIARCIFVKSTPVRCQRAGTSDERKTRTLNAGSPAIEVSENGMVSQRCAA